MDDEVEVKKRILSNFTKYELEQELRWRKYQEAVAVQEAIQKAREEAKQKLKDLGVDE